MEKPNVNSLENKTKDGIHMIIGLQTTRTIQCMIRETMIKKLGETVFTALPLENDWDSILDNGITKGCINWQFFGSCKPGNQTYDLTYHYEITYDIADGQFCIESKPIKLNHNKKLVKIYF